MTMALVSDVSTDDGYVILNDVITGELWSEAIAQHKEKWDFDIGSLPKVRSVEEVIGFIKAKESVFSLHRHDGKTLDRVRSSISRNLKPIERIIEATSSVAGKAFAPAETILGAAKVLVVAAKDVSSGFDQAEEGFRLMQSYFSQLGILKDKKITTELKNAVLMVFICTIEMLVQIGEHLKNGRRKRYARSLVYGECEELKAIIQSYKFSMKQQRIVIENTSYNLINKIDHQLSARNDEIELQRLLEWLTELDFQETHELIASKRFKGTCQWLFEHEKFKEWYRDGTDPILWCHGKAGSGKSIVTSALADFIDARVEPDAMDEINRSLKIANIYFYCDSQNPKTHSEIELLLSIVKTMVKGDQSIAKKLYLFRKEKGRRPRRDELLTFINSCSKYFDRIFVLIDALDECRKDSINKLMAVMKELEPFVRLFVTSRPHLELKSNIRPIVPLIKIDEANRSDIESYLKAVVDEDEDFNELISCEPAARERIIKTIIERVDGMFLLAHYQITDVCEQATLKDVYSCLNALNRNIYQYYEENLQRIDQLTEMVAEIIKKAIAFIHLAKRPLKIQELCHALSVSDSDTELDKLRIPSAMALRKNSAGLISFGENGTLTLVHLTFNEFLKKYPERLGTNREVEMVKSCLSYLSFDTFSSGPCKDNDSLKCRLQDYSFLDYAVHNLGPHLKNIPISQHEECLQPIFEFFDDSRKLSSLLQVLFLPKYWTTQSYNRFPANYGPVHLAVYFDLQYLLPRLYHRYTGIYSAHGLDLLGIAIIEGHVASFNYAVEIDYLSADQIESLFFKAVELGHAHMAEALILKGACKRHGFVRVALRFAVQNAELEIIMLIYEECVRNQFTHSHELLSIIAASASSETIQLYLDECTESKSQAESLLMCYAIINGNIEVCDFLCQKGVEYTSWEELRGSYEFFGIREHAFCDFSLVSHLLKTGVNANARAKGSTCIFWRRTLLQTATYYSQEKVVQLLLDEGADPNIVSGEKEVTPLYYAAAMGQANIAERLLESGADPNITDGYEEMTPLFVATLKGHQNIVRLLTSRTKEGNETVQKVNAIKKERGLLFQHLVAVIDMDILNYDPCFEHTRSSATYGKGQELLEAGLDINAELRTGMTALHEAAKHNHIHTLEFLLANGADVDKQDRFKRTALHFALERPDYKVVKMLLDWGATPDAEAYGQTPLLCAAKREKFNVVGLLAARGADINAEDHHGQRAIHYVACDGTENNLESLIEIGADVNVQDYWGQTAMMWLVFGHEYSKGPRRRLWSQKLDVLLRYGADVNISSRDGCTALHFAMLRRSNDQLCYLLSLKEVKLDAKANGNFRPIDVAVMTGNIAKVKLLIDKGAELRARGHRCTMIFDYDCDYADYIYYVRGRTLQFSTNNLINYLCATLLKWYSTDCRESGWLIGPESNNYHLVDDEKGDDVTEHVKIPKIWRARDLGSIYKDKEVKTEYTVLDLACFSGSEEMRRLVEDDLAKCDENLSQSINLVTRPADDGEEALCVRALKQLYHDKYFLFFIVLFHVLNLGFLESLHICYADEIAVLFALCL